MSLAWLPLEPLEQRYTEQWSRWFLDEFNRLGIDYVTIPGEKLTDTIELGSVLDAFGTNYWKSTQLANLIKAIRQGGIDALLFADLWYPGIESLEYIACLGGNRPKITGILHAGSYDSNDFTYRSGMRPWAHMLEACWLQMFDLVFVGTQYHKDLILKNHHVNPEKIHVTGLPFYPEEFTKPRQKAIKENLIVFPHRLDEEKHPEVFDALVWELRKSGLVFEAIKTAEQFTTKGMYYDTLSKARVSVSCASQETFGYAMLESVALGCIPFVPDALSYQELFPAAFRYKTFSELKGKVISALRYDYGLTPEMKTLSGCHNKEFSNSISTMIEKVLTMY